MRPGIQHLLSLPPKRAREFVAKDLGLEGDWFAASDPPGSALGSGGGTAHLLAEAWRTTGRGMRFGDWLRQSRKLVIHSGGLGRRLPAYAAAGKAFIPIPAMRWSLGQRLDQTLLDLQAPGYRRVLERAPPAIVAMVTSGDVLLRFGGALPALPTADVIAVGMWVRAEQAQHHGVFFCPRKKPETLAFFLQKPSPSRILELAGDYLFLIDTGVWLLSERAVATLFRKCGWDEGCQAFARGLPDKYELYAELGLGLGSEPSKRDVDVNALTGALVTLPRGEFYHFGTSRDLIRSVSALRNLVVDQTKLGLTSVRPHPDQYAQNSIVQLPIGPQKHTLWIENCSIPDSWQLAHEHVLTNVPENDWRLELEPGVCLDFVPIEGGGTCLRAYGMDDPFRGAAGEEFTVWFGRPASRWFEDRGIAWAKAGIDPKADLHDTPLFPVFGEGELDGGFVAWLTAAKPARDAKLAARWCALPRLSAREIAAKADFRRVDEQRLRNLRRILPALARNRNSIFYKLDLEATARLHAATGTPAPAPLSPADGVEPMKLVHDRMFRAAMARQAGGKGWEADEAAAFASLREFVVGEMVPEGVAPARCALDDQIVWGRSPVRLDLAGGWTDTPPYCLQHGGRVVNVAVDLNGQPPIQVFAKLSDRPELVIRSIDLGVEERVRTHDELRSYNQVGSGFTIAKAALALAGFEPRFHLGGGHRSLAEHLREFGGGIEVSLLCAVPKGSGLGTSSILAATVLGTLSELCGLHWDEAAIFRRTLALEQMLTTGGGWQDQAGGLFRGLKLVETEAGPMQKPTIRWLPDHFFSDAFANKTMLLYYTGITRTAKEILREIVRGMFLGARGRLEILGEIGLHADFTADVIQRHHWEGLCEAIRTSWDLNQRLDEGTNPPAVRAILDGVGDWLAGAKLLGAGGGGYLLMLAKDDAAARRIRQALAESPPNAKARFVNLGLSQTGLQVTRS